MALSIETQKARFNHVIELIDMLDPETVDLSTWWSSNAYCVIGYMILTPFARSQGLFGINNQADRTIIPHQSFRHGVFDGRNCPLYLDENGHQYISWGAVAAYFGISIEEAEDLYSSYAYRHMESMEDKLVAMKEKLIQKYLTLTETN